MNKTFKTWGLLSGKSFFLTGKWENSVSLKLFTDAAGAHGWYSLLQWRMAWEILLSLNFLLLFQVYSYGATR